MTRVFIAKNDISREQNEVVLTGENANHISRALRMRVGEELICCDGEGNDILCSIKGFEGKNVLLGIISEAPSSTEPPYKVTLFMALPKSDKMELVIQKAVELGVSEIVPFVSSRCISRPDERSKDKKTERWQKIALSAAEQCGRGRVPVIMPVVDFETAVNAVGEYGIGIFCYENEDKGSLSRLLNEYKNSKKYPDVGIMVGSEGGFSEKEAEAAVKAGWISVSLGKRILRCETAPLFVLSSLSTIWENCT